MSPGAGVKVGDELLRVEAMTVSELDMILIESILKSSASVDVTLRSVRAESSTNQQSSRPPSQLSLPSSQNNQVVEVAVASSAADMAFNSGTAGTNEIADDYEKL